MSGAVNVTFQDLVSTETIVVDSGVFVNNLQNASITLLPLSSNPTVSITGNAPNQSINFGIPAGITQSQAIAFSVAL